jgi:hypothetical protein
MVSIDQPGYIIFLALCKDPDEKDPGEEGGVAGGEEARLAQGRGLHSSASQLNFSRV